MTRWNDIADTVQRQLLAKVYSMPEWLLREPGYCPVKCDIGFAVLRDEEENEDIRRIPGDLPGEFITARMRPLTQLSIFDGTEDPTACVESSLVRTLWLPVMWSKMEISGLVCPPPAADIKLSPYGSWTVGLAVYEPQRGA